MNADTPRQHLMTAYWLLDQDLAERARTPKSHARHVTDKRVAAFHAIGRAAGVSTKYRMQDRRTQLGFPLPEVAEP